MNKEELKTRTKEFAKSVFRLANTFPKSNGAEVISYQILKSASSVAANYRAVLRAKSKADFINKLIIVQEEADETLFWLEFIQELEIISNESNEKLIKEANELVAIFSASIITLKKS